MTYSIGQLGKEFGLSRSTLIYYDKIGLLKPSGRSGANYREYTQKDRNRLKTIMTYREAGMSLKSIQLLLSDRGKANRTKVLEAQIQELNNEISQLRKQQQLTIELLKNHDINLSARTMSKEQWVRILEATGMSEKDMWQWHAEFEKRMPQAHQDFLESLNISTEEIREIRKKSGSPPE